MIIQRSQFPFSVKQKEVELLKYSYRSEGSCELSVDFYIKESLYCSFFLELCDLQTFQPPLSAFLNEYGEERVDGIGCIENSGFMACLTQISIGIFFFPSSPFFPPNSISFFINLPYKSSPNTEGRSLKWNRKLNWYFEQDNNTPNNRNSFVLNDFP